MDLAVSLVNEEVEKFAADFVACQHETSILNERGSRTGANTGAFYFVQRDSLVEFAALRRGKPELYAFVESHPNVEMHDVRMGHPTACALTATLDGAAIKFEATSSF